MRELKVTQVPELPATLLSALPFALHSHRHAERLTLLPKQTASPSCLWACVSTMEESNITPCPGPVLAQLLKLVLDHSFPETTPLLLYLCKQIMSFLPGLLTAVSPTPRTAPGAF